MKTAFKDTNANALNALPPRSESVTKGRKAHFICMQLAEADKMRKKNTSKRPENTLGKTLNELRLHYFRINIIIDIF